MALSPCAECGNNVSDKAVTCPACGVPIRSDSSSASSDNVYQGKNVNKGVTACMPQLPIGLYVATGVLGFPIGTAIASGCYLGANIRIKKGDYVTAEKYIKKSKIACWIILVPATLAAIMLILFLFLATR